MFYDAIIVLVSQMTQQKTVPRSFSLDPDDEFYLRDQAYYNLERQDQAYYNLERQNREMEEFVNQQQKTRNREKKLPLHVFFFAPAFETVIEGNKRESAGRLYSLEQHTREELNRLCITACT